MKVEEPVSKRTVKDVACVKVWFRLLNQHCTALNHIAFKKTTNSALLCLEPHLVHPVRSSIGLQRHQVAYVRQFVRVLRTRPRPIFWLSEIRRRLEGLLHNSPSPRSCACARSPLLRGYLHLFITRSLSLSSSSHPAGVVRQSTARDVLRPRLRARLLLPGTRPVAVSKRCIRHRQVPPQEPQLFLLTRVLRVQQLLCGAHASCRTRHLHFSLTPTPRARALLQPALISSMLVFFC